MKSYKYTVVTTTINNNPDAVRHFYTQADAMAYAMRSVNNLYHVQILKYTLWLNEKWEREEANK